MLHIIHIDLFFAIFLSFIFALRHCLLKCNWYFDFPVLGHFFPFFITIVSIDDFLAIFLFLYIYISFMLLFCNFFATDCCTSTSWERSCLSTLAFLISVNFWLRRFCNFKISWNHTRYLLYSRCSNLLSNWPFVPNFRILLVCCWNYTFSNQNETRTAVKSSWFEIVTPIFYFI